MYVLLHQAYGFFVLALETAVCLSLSLLQATLSLFGVAEGGSMLDCTKFNAANELSLGTDQGKRTHGSLFLSSQVLHSVGQTQRSSFALLPKSVRLGKSPAQYCGLHGFTYFCLPSRRSETRCGDFSYNQMQ